VMIASLNSQQNIIANRNIIMDSKDHNFETTNLGEADIKIAVSWNYIGVGQPSIQSYHGSWTAKQIQEKYLNGVVSMDHNLALVNYY